MDLSKIKIFDFLQLCITVFPKGNIFWTRGNQYSHCNICLKAELDCDYYVTSLPFVTSLSH